MAFEVIDRNEGLFMCEGQRLGGHDPHHHAADQARPARRGDAVEIRQAEPCLVERLRDQPVDPFEVRTRGDLGHDAAEAAMLCELAVDGIGKDSADRLRSRRRLDHGDSRLVAARFDAHHAHA